MTNVPEPGIAFQARWVRAIDGDTAEIEITRRVSVRIRGVNTPERKEPGYGVAKQTLEDIGRRGKIFTVFVPTNGTIELMDFNSFNRVVADVFSDNTDVAQYLIDTSVGVPMKDKNHAHS